MSEYLAVYEARFVKNLKRYNALRERVKRRVDRILQDPYANTEFLGDVSGKLNLRGCSLAGFGLEHGALGAQLFS